MPLSSVQGPFSAVCKFTGAAVFDALGGTVPVGLVESAWGGTRIESWSSPDALAACPATTTAGCGSVGRNPPLATENLPRPHQCSLGAAACYLLSMYAEARYIVAFIFSQASRNNQETASYILPRICSRPLMDCLLHTPP